MGLLDDAIRQHLDLKRRHGADPTAVARLENEAFGPIERGEAHAAPGPDHPGPAAEPFLAPGSEEPLDRAEADEEWPAARPAAVAPEVAPLPPSPPAPAAPFAPEPVAPTAHEATRAAPQDPAPNPAERPRAAPRPAAPLSSEPPRAAPPEPLRPGGSIPLDDVGQRTVEFSAQHPEPDPQPDAEPGEHDELEETPEFLQETPEHDRLWFEQKPPRDFDF